MKLSIIVYLPTKTNLALTYLYQSLQQQSLSELECLIYHAPGLDLPEQVSEWAIVQQLEAGEQAADAWQAGLKKAQGEMLAFIQTSVRFEPQHFELAYETLKQRQTDAVVFRAEYLDAEALPTRHQLPNLKANEWNGFCFSSRLLWPIESMVFKKSVFEAENLPQTSQQLSACDLLDWLQAHPIAPEPLCSLQVSYADFHLNTISQTRKDWLLQQLEKQSAADLAPAYALSDAPTEAQQDAFLVQALRNQGLQLEADQYHLNQLRRQNKVVLWISTDQQRDQVYLQALLAENWQPIVIHLRQEPSLSGELEFKYQQSHGIGQIEITGISHHPTEPHSNKLNALEHQILDLTRKMRPAAIHLTGFEAFNYRLPIALSENQTPVYLSLFSDSLLQGRELLRFPETLNEQATENKQPALFIQTTQANEYLEHLFQNVIAKVFVHDQKTAESLEQFGLKNNQFITISSAQALSLAYQEEPVLAASFAHQSESLVFESHFKQTFESHLASDLEKFEPEDRVLLAGHNILNLTQQLRAQNQWVQGACFSDEQSQAAKKQGLPLSFASIDHLSALIHGFDQAYTPYLLETFSFSELKRFVSSIVLNLKKQGHWLLRSLDPALLQKNFESFWLSENNIRPYSPTLIKAILEHAGFVIETTEISGLPWASNGFNGRLMTEGLPLVNFPIITENLKNYWETNLPKIELKEDQQVLLVGPQLFKTWLIYRVQCAYLMGISLNLNEFTKRPKTSEKYQFRHSHAIDKTLKGLQKKYDLIILQGVIETFAPLQARELLSHCHNLLSEGGQIHIETLQISEDEDPLFWQSALNQRPYPELEALLSESGFKTLERKSIAQHMTYLCEKSEVQAKVPEPIDLPDFALRLTHDQPKKLELNSIYQLRHLTESEYDCIILDSVLEQLPAKLLSNALQKLAAALKYNGSLIVRFHRANADIWKNHNVQRPYASALVENLLSQAGFQKSQLEQQEQFYVWSGYKRLALQPREKTPFKIIWEGDVFNYHSLATVNRALLHSWIKAKSPQFEIRNLNNPDFTPTPNELNFKLYQAHETPLLDQPDLTIRHAWPPDFSVPKTLGHWVMIQPWEFGAVPENWIYNMNKLVDQVWVPSEFVKQSYLDSGLLPEKIAVVPNGVDVDLYQPEAPILQLATQKKFKFLFVGGGTKRKGLDLLMNAFAECFNATDDVCMVIKEFGAGKFYDGINAKEWLERYRQNNPQGPEFLHLTELLSEAEMPALYNACDVLVHPYRGEGFAMPIAEAMACEKPVIVTNYGACLDFCNETNAYLIPMQIEVFNENKIDEFSTVDFPHWAEPDYDALKALLLEVYNQPQEAQLKAKAAREMIVQNFTWKHALDKLKKQIKTIQSQPIFRLHREHILAALLGEAFTAVDEQDFTNAVAKFKRALQIDPFQPSVYYNLGVAHLMRDQYEEALEALTRSLREGDITGDLCYAMATVLRHLGDQETSQDFYDKARELNPDLFAMA